MSADFPKIKRPLYEMPDFVKNALEENNLMDSYRKKPAYTQIDYLWWIKSANKEEIRKERLKQMMKELESS